MAHGAQSYLTPVKKVRILGQQSSNSFYMFMQREDRISRLSLLHLEKMNKTVNCTLKVHDRGDS